MVRIIRPAKMQPHFQQPLDLPRILCLHGGGSTAEIFRMQAHELIRQLSSFRLVFADAPFLSGPGPDIVPVYEAHGPFRRWLRWKDSHPEISDAEGAEAVLRAVEQCKLADPGSGPWVGLMGFSQGAKIAASLLYHQQLCVERDGVADTDYRFAVVMAGRGPLLSFSQDTDDDPSFITAGQVGLHFQDHQFGASQHLLRLPTIHVHGLNDEGLPYHRKLLKRYHEPGTASLIEWDGAHRLPLKRADVAKVVSEVHRVAWEQSVQFFL